MRTWYIFTLLYTAGMAATGLTIRQVMPENALNTPYYFHYLAVLTVFWPVTVIAALTDDGQGF